MLTPFTNTKKIVRAVLLTATIALLIVSGPLGAQAATDIHAYDNAPTLAGECVAPGVFGSMLCGVSVAIQSLTIGLIYVIGKLFAIILSAFTVASIWAIKTLGVTIATHQAVSIGFGFSLQIANVVFVIAIIVIAFSTILRWHEYEAKKLLPKLIIAALLVNFSLLIAGLMLDVSNVFTLYFMTDDKVSSDLIGDALSPQLFSINATYGLGSLSSNDDVFANLKKKYDRAEDKWGDDWYEIGTWDSPIARKGNGTKEIIIYEFGYGRGPDSRARFEADLNSHSPTLLRQLKVNSSGAAEFVGGDIDIGQVWSEFLDLLPKVIFSVFMTFVAMMTMLAVFLMAVIRDLWVVILLITMPLAWALRALPKYEEYWKKWWEKFLNWGILYLPTLSFFLFVAVQTAVRTRGGTGSDPGFKGITPQTADFLGVRTGGPTVLESVVITLIIIGIMIAGLKVAQAMGAAVAGGIANVTGRGVRKLAGGFVKAPLTVGGAIGGGLAGLASRFGYRYGKEGREARAQIDNLENTGDSLKAKLAREEYESNKPSILGSVKAGASRLTPQNLYGWATERLSTGLAHLSFLPGATEGAQFFGKLSGASSEAMNKAMKETDGLSPAGIRAWIGAAALKDTAHQAAAMAIANKEHMIDALPHDSSSLKKFADAVAAFNQGVKREKIDLLKALAAHNPFDAKAITGEETAAVFKRLDGEAIRDLDLDHWTTKQRLDALEMMSDGQKRTLASKNEAARNEVLAHAITRLSKAFNAFTSDDERLMVADFQKVVAGDRDKDLMKKIEGHLETLNDSNKKDLRDAIGKIDADARTAVSFAKDAAHAVISTKNRSEHPAHGYPDYEIWTLLGNLMKSKGGNKSSGSSPAKSASASHGH